MASAGTVAWVMYQKFCNSLPYYRQEKDWEQYGASITRATMANWVIRNSEAFFHPMYKYFHRKLLERGFVMADETPLQVLHEAGRRAHIRRYLTDAVPQGKKLAVLRQPRWCSGKCRCLYYGRNGKSEWSKRLSLSNLSAGKMSE